MMALVCCQLLPIVMALTVVLLKLICDASLLTVPRNSVAVIGDRVELKCSADGDQHVIWGFASFNTSKDTDIYFGDDIISPSKSKYKIDKRNSGQHNLVIDSVDLDHAGRYQCITIATGNKIAAHLTVLVSSPECSANTSSEDWKITENGYLWMWCRIIYAGDMIPIFTWTKTNTEDVIAADTSTSDKRSVPFTTTSSIIAQLTSDDNSVIFMCKIAFQLPNNSEGNAPDYEYTWNYTANVLYGPRNLSIVMYADRLECFADGNPVPTYSWTNLETNRSVEGSVLTFDKALDSDKEHYIECTVVNGLGAQRKSISHMNNDSVTFHRTVVEAAVGGGSLLLLLMMVAVSLFVTKKKLKEKSERSENLRESTQQSSDVGYQPRHKTLEVHQPSQHSQGIEQPCENESYYNSCPMEKSSTVHQQDNYSQLRIYGNDHTEYYVNQRDIELEQH